MKATKVFKVPKHPENLMFPPNCCGGIEMDEFEQIGAVYFWECGQCGHKVGTTCESGTEGKQP